MAGLTFIFDQNDRCVAKITVILHQDNRCAEMTGHFHGELPIILDTSVILVKNNG